MSWTESLNKPGVSTDKFHIEAVEVARAAFFDQVLIDTGVLKVKDKFEKFKNSTTISSRFEFVGKRYFGSQYFKASLHDVVEVLKYIQPNGKIVTVRSPLYDYGSCLGLDVPIYKREEYVGLLKSYFLVSSNGLFVKCSDKPLFSIEDCRGNVEAYSLAEIIQDRMYKAYGLYVTPEELGGHESESMRIIREVSNSLKRI